MRSSPPPLPTALRRVVAVAFVLLAGCAEQPTDPTLVSADGPLTFAVVAGDGQSGPVGEELAQPLVVQVLKPNGRPASDQLVNFRVRSGSGSLYAGSSLTDSRGMAQDYWTLGYERGQQQVEVVAVHPTTGAKQSFATFNASGLIPAMLALVAGDSASFGNVAIGATSAPSLVRFVNSGDFPTGSLSVALAGFNSGDFQILSDGCSGQVLAANATCDMSVAFRPTAIGFRFAMVEATASPGGIAMASLRGIGVP